jgi:uncharacterized repeat protein (TIGR03803 family)
MTGCLLGVFCVAGGAARAQVAAKVADLTVGLNTLTGQSYGTAAPYGSFAPVGTNLLFLTQGGGTNGFGTVSLFNPATGSVDMLATLGSTAPGAEVGKTSFGTPVVIGNQAWFTTSAGGAGNKGSLAYIDLTTQLIQTAYSFPTNSAMGAGPRGNPLQIGNDLYVLTSLGGAFSKGTLVKFSLVTSNVTLIQSFDGTNIGGQPFGCSMTPVGSDYYFTTFTGGTNVGTFDGTSFGNGAGTLEKFSFDTNGVPSITKMADLGLGPTALLAGNPVLVGTNSLYFTATGSNPDPGSIIRYDLTSHLWTNIFSFPSNAAALYGKQPYCTPIEWNGELYFTTFTGGTSNKGVLAKLTLTNNVYTKLADLDGPLLGASPQYTAGLKVHNPVTGRDSLYFGTKSGGSGNNGTILQVYFPPPPIVVSVTPISGTANITWTGGYAPFTVQSATDVSSGNWNTEATGLTNSFLNLPVSNPTMYYRVSGNSQ